MTLLWGDQGLIKSFGELHELRQELPRRYNQEPNMMLEA